MPGKRGGGKNQHVGDAPSKMAERILESFLNERRWRDVRHAFRTNRTVIVELDGNLSFSIAVHEVRTQTPEEGGD